MFRITRSLFGALILLSLALAPAAAIAQSRRAELYQRLFASVGTNNSVTFKLAPPTTRMQTLRQLFPRVKETLLDTSFTAVGQAVQTDDPGDQPQDEQKEEFGDWVRMTTTPLYVSGQGFKTSVMALINLYHESKPASPHDEAEKEIATQMLRDLDSLDPVTQVSVFNALHEEKDASKNGLTPVEYVKTRNVLKAIANRRSSQLATVRTAQEDPKVTLTPKARLSLAANVPTNSDGLYFIGLGYAVNNYVHVTVGFSFLTADDKKGKLAYGLSFDLSMFQALFGGGKKQKDDAQSEKPNG